MSTEYGLEEIRALLTTHLIQKGFNIEEGKILHKDIPWRPPIYGSKGDITSVIDIRLNNTITQFWLDIYKKTYNQLPKVQIFVAIPEDIIIPYQLGNKLESNNIGIILVSDEGITYLLEPRSTKEREITRVIRKKIDSKLDKNTYKDLDPYVKEITDAVNIFEIGCPRESIGAIGRVLETSINDYLKIANKKRKIKLSERKRKSMDFDTKIRYLASDNAIGTSRKKRKIITQSQESKMLSVKWDRNTGDHPANEGEIEEMIRDSRIILELGINMIRVMKGKMSL